MPGNGNRRETEEVANRRSVVASGSEHVDPASKGYCCALSQVLPLNAHVGKGLLSCHRSHLHRLTQVVAQIKISSIGREQKE